MIPIIKEVKWLKPRKGHKTRGMAIFPYIFLSIGAKDDLKLIEHEKEHIKQWITHLLIFFPIKYGIYHLIYGYWDNPFEVAARKRADDWERIITK